MLSLEAMKANLRVKHDAQDALLVRLAESARAHLERKTGWYLGEPAARTSFLFGNGSPTLWLPQPPIPHSEATPIAITEAVYGGTATALESSAYRIIGHRLDRFQSRVWALGYEYALTHHAGYGLDSGPDDLLQAAHMLVAHWFRNPEAVVNGSISSEVALGVSELIAPYVSLPI